MQCATAAALLDMIIKILINIQDHDRSILTKLLVIMSLLLQIYSLGKVGACAYIIRAIDVPLGSATLASIYIWCFLMLIAYSASTLSNTILMVFRSCCKHKILIEASVPKHKRLAENDSIIELR